jgi:superfamily II DNA or RNA helicase
VQQSPTPLAAGQQVTVRDESWVVLGAERFDAVHLVRLRGTGEGNRGELRTIVSPFDVVRPVAASSRVRRGSRQRALAAAAAAIAEATPWDQCRTAATAAIHLHAWQLEPAMAAVMGATRILLADHVGLGKTIQATLIVTELCARGLAERVLVLTPASLREQWAVEMHERFRLRPTIFDQATLANTVASLPVGVNPWQTAPLIISSIDLVKRADIRSALDNVAFDILIVDEAHHLTPGTDRGDLVADIAARTPWVVLATATPHSGDETAFTFLRQLGAIDGEPPVVFRRSRPVQPHGGFRRSRIVPIAPTTGERLLLAAVQRYVRALTYRRGRGDGIRLVASVIARRASSSAEAVSRTLARRIALLSREPVEPPLPRLPWDEADASDAGVDDILLGATGLDDVQQEVECLRQLAALAKAAAARSSKITFVRQLLRRTSEQLLVFSEYRDVAEIVAAALEDLAPVATLHGGLSPRDRRHVVRSFNAGQVRTLVATDAAGEGLNLHYRCRLLVNIELPWMPRRLEQRIGRIDRLGQTRPVHALHLVHRDSFEGTVVARLERRRSAAHARTLAAPPLETATRPALERRLRAAVDRYRQPPVGGAIYSPARPPGGDGACLLVTSSAAVQDESGRMVRNVAVAVTVALGKPRRQPTRALVRSLIRDAAVQSAVRDEIERHSAGSLVLTRSTAAALERRLAACLTAVARRRRHSAWQGSLFDRSAESAAEAQHAALADLEAHLQRRLTAVRALLSLRLEPATPVAAWLVR